MKARFALAVVGLVLVLGLAGALAGPSWEPTPLREQLTSADPDPAVRPPEPTDAVGTYEVEVTDMEIDLGGAVVQARLTAPVGAPPDRPAMLFMHGAGTGLSSNFADQAQALASAGVYVLVPAKRMDTYTTTDRDYVQMAQDYLVSWRALSQVPGVDPTQVGVYAESEGCWIAPVAAVLEPSVAFVVLVSAPVVTPREQGAFAMDSYLRNTHVPDQLLRAIPRATGANVPGGGFAYAEFDVHPWQQQMRQPVLMVYGTGDTSMPVVQAPLEVRDDLAVAGNDALTIRYLDGANHGIRVGSGDDQQLAPGFTQLLTAWPLGLPATATLAPQVAGAQPEQLYEADAPPKPRWYANGDMLVWTGVGAGALLVVGPLVWLGSAARRRDGVRLPAPVARHTAAVGLAAVAVLVVFVAYAAQVADLALNYRTDDVVVLGGWVLVQGVGVLAAAVLVRSVQVARRGRSQADLRVGVAGAILWWATHAGAVGLLLIAAYWGVYPSLV